MIMCPYCLTPQAPLPTNLCINCGVKLPTKYVESTRNSNLITLGTFGLKSHGKTALLASLMQSVQAVGKIVPGSFLRPLDDDTQKQLSKWADEFRTGRVGQASTPVKAFPQPLVLLNNKFLTSQPKALVAYDLAGEVLDKAGSQPELVRALNKVHTIWFVVSLDDLMDPKRNAGFSLADLFNIYMEAMNDLNLTIRNKNILVVYTKADLLMGIKPGLQPLPLDVEQYIATDPYDQLRIAQISTLKPFPFDENAYFTKMNEISDALQDYTMNYIDGGIALVNMIQDAGANLYFTMNTAYGSDLDPTNPILSTEVRSQRVLDVLIWAIKLNQHVEVGQEVALIVPPTITSAGLASQASVQRFYDELVAQGGFVSTWYPGQLDPAFPPGTAPTGVQSTSTVPLIGPILDHLKPETAAVILLDGPEILDLPDIFQTKRSKQVLVVVSRRDLMQSWLPYCKLCNSEGEIAPIVSTFFKQAGLRK